MTLSIPRGPVRPTVPSRAGRVRRSSPISAVLLAPLLLAFPFSPADPLHAIASIETPGPAYIDWKRGVEKQNDAAREARREVSAGAPATQRALALLADDSGYVRDAVFGTILEDWSDEAVLGLAGGLLSPDELVAENVAELLGRRKPDGAGAILAKAVLRARDEGARVLMLRALGEIGGAAGTETARTIWEREKRSWLVRAEALVVLAKLEGADARDEIDEALNERRILPLRIAGLRALASFDDAGAFTAALAQLGDPPKDRTQVWGPRLTLAALATLATADRSAVGRETQVAAIDRLLGSLEDSEGCLRTRTFETLTAITGEDLPAQAVSWRAWWDTKKESWTPGPATPGAGAAPAGGDPESDEGGTSVVRFHGIPVDSERVTFLQDLSGGMSRTLAGEMNGSGPTRLDHAKDELARVLGALDDRTWVNVITFASAYFAAQSEPRLLGRARPSIVKFCREQEIPTAPGHARGNVYDALAFAATSPYVDSIYLVSEGAPTEGKFHDYDRFLWHFERLNRWYGARVHVLLVAETGGRNRAFLQSLAEGTGGTMRAVRTEGVTDAARRTGATRPGGSPHVSDPRPRPGDDQLAVDHLRR